MDRKPYKEMSDVAITRAFRKAVRVAIEEKKEKGLPISKYDDETKEAYLEYPDGRIEYVR